MTLPLPAHLAGIGRLFLVEEVRAEVRHATRNRLGAIRNAVFYLKRQVDTKTELSKEVPRVPRFFELIETEIESASSMLTGELPPTESGETCSPAEAAKALLDALPEQPGVALLSNLRGERRAAIAAQELQLATFCLIENALLSTGVSEVSVEVREDDAGIHVSVTDNGAGFQEGETLEKVCAPFYSGRTGQGLGLTIARRIVERRWRGEITLERGPEGGARLSLVLPHAAWSAPDKGLRVLFVDDDDTSRLTLGTLLEDEGFEVIEAASLAEARPLLESDYALAILDLNLPDGRGTELVPSLKASGSSPVIVVLSGHRSPEGAADADLVLTKGDDPESLLSALHMALKANEVPPCA